MQSLVPWSWGNQYLRDFFDEEYFPRLDIEDKDDNLLAIADVPGFEQKDIKIEAEKDRLIIEGKMDQEKEEKNKNFFRKERKSGVFYREILLPCTIQPNKVLAKFKNGTIEIVLPKERLAEEKRVKINIR